MEICDRGVIVMRLRNWIKSSRREYIFFFCLGLPWFWLCAVRRMLEASDAALTSKDGTGKSVCVAMSSREIPNNSAFQKQLQGTSDEGLID